MQSCQYFIDWFQKGYDPQHFCASKFFRPSQITFNIVIHYAIEKIGITSQVILVYKTLHLN